MEFNATEVQYFATLWLLTFSVGVFRTLRDRDYQSLWDCVCAGGVGGFYAFAVVAVCSYYGPDIASGGWAYLGLSAAIGLLGKEQDQIMRALFRWAAGKFFGSEFKADIPEQPQGDDKTGVE